FPVRNMFGWQIGALRALDGVSFEMRRGETLGIVGESGCGKSTLGKALAGIHAPSGGRILFSGIDITGCSAAQPQMVAPKVQRGPEAGVVPPGRGQFARSALHGAPLACRAAHRPLGANRARA